jgi:hypothetical protein
MSGVIWLRGPTGGRKQRCNSDHPHTPAHPHASNRPNRGWTDSLLGSAHLRQQGSRPVLGRVHPTQSDHGLRSRREMARRLGSPPGRLASRAWTGRAAAFYRFSEGAADQVKKGCGDRCGT